jgi:hypothetical protein
MLSVQARIAICLLILIGCVPSQCQINRGELKLAIRDPSGRPVQSSVHLISDANQYNATLNTDSRGSLVVQTLPYGTYHLEVQAPGFGLTSETVHVTSALPVQQVIYLNLPVVQQNVTVEASNTLIDPHQPGAVAQLGTSLIQHRLTSIPGHSVQDLVNTQPGWLYEGSAVLHPRGSEYQTQFVIDGVPLTDNRSPSFGPELEADDLESMSIYTAGIPAEYGRKMGGVIELNTVQNAQAGLHGQVVLSGGSFTTAGAFAKAQYTWGRNSLGGSANGSRTDRYLSPVVPQNYSNAGTLGDFSAHYQRSFDDANRLTLSVRHELSRYDIPNEQIQEAAGQRQTADNVETMGIASYEHIFSSRTLGNLRGMVRDDARDFNSNAQSTPVEVFQHNGFREGYFKAALTTDYHSNEFKVGVESDNTFLHENFRYAITDPTRFDDDTPPAFDFADRRPDLEQAAFIEDLLHKGQWTVRAGLRWDHYQLLVNKQAFEPRFSIARYFPSVETVAHFSYDRVFQTPSFDNLLLSSSPQVDSLDPAIFLRLPVEPSSGDYYEAGVSKAFAQKLRVDVNYFRRYQENFADDDEIENTSVSFPITFRRAVIYGAEAKVQIPGWRRISGSASYSWQVSNVWNPVTGGLFLGDDAGNATSQLTGHFPGTQDQRNTARGRLRYKAQPWFWVSGGFEFNSGLPFEFNGDPDTVLAQYGQQVLNRINFTRGRIDPTFLVNASAGLEIHRSDKFATQFQIDGENLSNVLNVMDFGGLFSGNAIGPSRSCMARLTWTF